MAGPCGARLLDFASAACQVGDHRCVTWRRAGSARTEAGFLGCLAAGEFELEPVASVDLFRMADLVRTYADFPLGAAYASVASGPQLFGLQPGQVRPRRLRVADEFREGSSAI